MAWGIWDVKSNLIKGPIDGPFETCESGPKCGGSAPVGLCVLLYMLDFCRAVLPSISGYARYIGK
jgi:hypothetical protein